TLPTEDVVADTAGRLDAAVRRAEAAAATDAGRARRLAALLQQAVDVHSVDGHATCPVCHTGALEEGWRQATLDQIEELTAEADEATRADKDLREARQDALALLTPPPPILGQVDRDLVDTAVLTEAWQR